MIFAPYGSLVFQSDLQSAFADIGAAVAKCLGTNLLALVLGGGYGRGEGGVIQHNGEKPYNDFDFFIIVRTTWGVQKALVPLAQFYTRKYGVQVDFSRPLTIRHLRFLPHYLMWHDLWHGHMVLVGEADILKHNLSAHIRLCPPKIEALKLLLNRGTGLLMAKQIWREQQATPDFDFVRRNVFKCLLSLGDALLLGHGLYKNTLAGRLEAIATLFGLEKEFPEITVLHTLYESAANFKLRPDDISWHIVTAELLQNVTKIWLKTVLYIEQLRTNKHWLSIDDYCGDSFIREEKLHCGWQRKCLNIWHNVRCGKLSWLYPREVLFRSLPMLLQQDNISPFAYQNYLRWWSRYN